MSQTGRRIHDGTRQENAKVRTGGMNRCGSLFLRVITGVAVVLTVLALCLPQVLGRAHVGTFKAAKVQIEANFSPALEKFKEAVGRHPTTAEGLTALTVIPAGNPGKWTGPIMSSVPRDPWGRKYRYICPGTHNATSYDLWSCGPDGKDGGGDDVTNWAGEPAKNG
jgi:general secretion pathway protein G